MRRRRRFATRIRKATVRAFTLKHYACSYDFYIVISVNSPCFNKIRLKLNSSSVGSDEKTLLDGSIPGRTSMGGVIGGSRTSNADEVRASVKYQQYEQRCCHWRLAD